MTKTSNVLLTGVVLLLGTIGWLLAPVSSIAQERRPAAARDKEDGIAISLRGLNTQLDSRDAKRLFGATRLVGFLLAEDEAGKDCILICAQEPGRPLLRLDDLAVAYKNVRAGDDRPACTIDPRADVLKRLAEVGQKVMSAGEPSAIERHLQEWKKLSGGAQDVKVFNVDPETTFGKNDGRRRLPAKDDL